VGEQDERDEALHEERSREADDEARRQVEEARRRADELVAERQRQIADLTDGLIARAEDLLEQIEAEDSSASRRSPPAAASDPPVESGPSEQQGPGPDVARLVATQMAASGSTREEVQSHLRTSLKVEDPGPILDEVFGPGSPGDAQAPWSRPARD
jgi:hypothetical protein